MWYAYATLAALRLISLLLVHMELTVDPSQNVGHANSIGPFRFESELGTRVSGSPLARLLKLMENKNELGKDTLNDRA